MCAVVCREAHHAHDAAARRPPWRSSLQNYGGSPSPLTGDRVCTGPPLTGVLRGRGLTGVGPTGSPYLRGIGVKKTVPVTGPPWVALLAGHVLLAEVPDPRGAGLTSDEAWALVRDRVLALAASSTDAAIAAWARSFVGEYAAVEDSAVGGGRGSGPLCKLPGFMRPGEEASCSIFGVQWRIRDHGELLSVGGGVAERAKCLYLSVARSLGMEPEVLLTGLRSQAQLFVGTVPAPKHGEMVPEAILYAFELAHDLLERDHPQMRAALLWFGDEILAKHQVNFVCCMPDGDVRVELFKGRQFTSSNPSSLLGWCVCASAHARELVAPVSLGSMDEWELTVMERTGVAPGQFHMSGYKHLMRALRSFRGDHRVRDPATLFKCEVCPSACAVPLRVRQRRFIGAEGVVSDPLMVMASEAGLAPLVSEARTVLSGMSMDREAAAAAAVASVLAGTATVSSSMDRPVGYAGVCDERLGRSTVQELQFRPTGVGLNRLCDLNSGCLRSSGLGAWASMRASRRKTRSFFGTSVPCVRWAPSRRSRPH